MNEQSTNLNPAQEEAIRHPSGPALVLAGAGSGKTTVLTRHAAWLIEQGVAPSSILLVTFTNKAAGEMKERILKLTGLQLPFAGTFHSTAARILRSTAHLRGLTHNFVIYDSDDQVSLMKTIYKSLGIDATHYKPAAVRAAISKAKNELISSTQFMTEAVGDFDVTVAKLYKAYTHALQEANAVDFDDLLMHVVTLLTENATIRAEYQAAFSHILVDEYQDTNKAQYAFTQLLAHPQNNLYVVGDFSQSIYAWRGADYRNMLHLKRDYPTITEYRLEQNYRSTQTILDAATAIISLDTDHPILELWTQRQESQPLTLSEHATGDREAQKVVDDIVRLSRTIPLSEMAILYRTNAQSRLFEEMLIRAGVPYRLIGGTKFYERMEVKDVLCYARLLVNPTDTVSLARAQKLGKRKLVEFLSYRDTLPEDTLNTQPVSVLLKDILEKTTYLERYDTRVSEDEERLENITELINMASQFDSLTGFLENIALLQDDHFTTGAGRTETIQSAVNVMSLHSAKGLEFEAVFLVGLEDGLLPHSHALISPPQMAEERRLTYVGITRAKRFLFLSYARSRYQYGTRTGSVPSRFLKDIPQHLYVFRTDQETSEFSRFVRPPATGRRLVVDDDLAEAALRGEIDLEVFIDS
ncbi:UvrD-helicase domain-containing protein [Candidatus Woesebacteria bacterium]|nr:UvrD-helicase domain-containing protein [Candidatus Woesebacteria bacterium]